MRRGHLYGVLALLVLLAIGHWAYWYRPRERAGAPDRSTVPGAVFSDSGLTHALWLPFPHQNLAELEESLGDMEELFLALSRVGAGSLPGMPSFGAADVPPSSELALAADQEGDVFMAAARVYPIPALLARWAGRLAGNPLLAGGVAEIDGREVVASWEGNTWIVTSRGRRPPAVGQQATTQSEALALEALAPEALAPEALAWMGLGAPQGPVPAGRYRLYRDGRDLALVGGDVATVQELVGLGTVPEAMPLVVAQSFRTKGRLQARLLGLLPGVESLAGLPGAVTVWRGKKRWKPPGERVLSVLGDGPPSRTIAGWKVVALDETSLDAGQGLVELAVSLKGRPPLDLAVWIELRSAEQLVDQVVEALEAVPLIGRREAKRWRAGANVLRRFDTYHRLTAFATADPPAFVARLERYDPGDGTGVAEAGVEAAPN